MRPRRTQIAVLVLTLICGMTYRYGELFRSVDIDIALYWWHIGASVTALGLCYLSIQKTSAEIRSYLKALYPILIAHIISDVLMRGNLSALDHASTLIAAVIITKTTINHGRRNTKQQR